MQLHIAVVEVDTETYKSKILDYAIVDDCGKVINHMIVQGQVHGGAAHGLGAALIEIMPFDKEGNVLAGSFTDYSPITINNMPDLKCANMETPSPFSYNGAKGMGEGGGAPVHAISAALQDALHDKGIIIQHAHNSPMALYDYINEKKQRPVSVVR
jgi:2-furoyl-CoA dehydrogenase large subunit